MDEESPTYDQWSEAAVAAAASAATGDQLSIPPSAVESSTASLSASSPSSAVALAAGVEATGSAPAPSAKPNDAPAVDPKLDNPAEGQVVQNRPVVNSIVFYLAFLVMFGAIFFSCVSVFRWAVRVEVARDIVSRHTVLPPGHVATFINRQSYVPIFWYQSYHVNSERGETRHRGSQGENTATENSDDAGGPVVHFLTSGSVVPSSRDSAAPKPQQTSSILAQDMLDIDIDNDDDYERMQTGAAMFTNPATEPPSSTTNHGLSAAELNAARERAVHYFETDENSFWKEICGPFNQYDPNHEQIKHRRHCWDVLKMEVIRIWAPEYHRRLRHEFLSKSPAYAQHKDTRELRSKIVASWEKQFGMSVSDQQELHSRSKQCVCSTEIGFVEQFVLACEPRIYASGPSEVILGAPKGSHPWLTQECEFFVNPRFVANEQETGTREVRLQGSFLSYNSKTDSELFQADHEFAQFYNIENGGEIIHPDLWNVSYYTMPHPARMSHFYNDVFSNPYTAYKELHGKYQQRHRQQDTASNEDSGDDESILFIMFDKLRYRWFGGDLKKRETLKDIVAERDALQDYMTQSLSNWLQEYDLIQRRLKARREANRRRGHEYDGTVSGLEDEDAGFDWGDIDTTWSIFETLSSHMWKTTKRMASSATNTAISTLTSPFSPRRPEVGAALQAQFAEMANEDLAEPGSGGGGSGSTLASNSGSSERDRCKHFRLEIQQISDLNETYLEDAILRGVSRECLRTTFALPKLQKQYKQVKDFTLRCLAHCDRKHKLNKWLRGLHHLEKYGTATEVAAMSEMFSQRTKVLRTRRALTDVTGVYEKQPRRG